MMGGEEAAPEAIELRIRELFGAANLPLRLRDLSIDEGDTSGISDNVDDMGILGQYSGSIGTAEVDSVIDCWCVSSDDLLV